MPLITLAQVRTLLSIATADTSRDTLITTLIPLVQSYIVDYCNNSFLLIDTQIEDVSISFTAGAPAYISDSNSGFVDAGFVDGCDVKVQGSGSNDGIYNVATVAAGRLTLLTGEVLITEAAGLDITITRVRWPKDLQMAAAHIINYQMATQGKLVKSETLPGGYSVTFRDGLDAAGGGGIYSCLNRYRKPYK